MTYEEITVDGMGIGHLVESIRDNGWVGGPILIDGSYDVILDGNHRYRAAKYLGWDDSEIPTIELRDWCDEFNVDLDEYLDGVEVGTTAYDEAVNDLCNQYMPSDAYETYGLFEGNF